MAELSRTRERDAATSNPLLDAFRAAVADGAEPVEAVRDRLVARYSFAVPDDAALDAIARASPHGLVELGAGTGYWCHLLRDRVQGEVRAFDAEPAPSPANPWFAGTQPWFDVRRGDERVADHVAPATLLLVWPTRNETWAMDAALRHHAAGGTTLVYVGEPPGGHTGDDGLHAVLGELRDCAQCRYGVLTAACICGIAPCWQRREEITIPNWPGFTDSVRVYERVDRRAPRRSRFLPRRRR